MSRYVARTLLVLWLAILTFATLQLNHTQWQSSIIAFLPAAEATGERQLLRHNPANQQVRLVLSGGDPNAYTEFAETVHQHTPTVQWLNPLKESNSLQSLYKQYSGLLVTDTDFQLLTANQFDPLILQAWQQFSSPVPITVSDIARDPLLLAERYVRQHHANFAEIHRFGFALSKEPLEWLLIGTLTGDGFDRAAGDALANAVANATAQLQAVHPDAEVATSGIAFHTSEAAAQAEFEMNTFGLISILGVVGLLWLCLRRLTAVFLALGVLLFSLSTGFAMVILLFKEIHLIALVFATTLVGIAVDYAIHGMLAAGDDRIGLKRLLPHLRLGVLTTLLGYLALWLLPFPLLQQVSVFIASGLIAAYITVQIGFKKITTHSGLQTRPIITRAADMYQKQWQRISPVVARSLALGLGVCGVLLISFLTFNDNVVGLTQSSAKLLAAEAKVQQVTQAENTQSHWVVQQSPDIETLLQEQEQLRAQLESLDTIVNWQMLADFLPSATRQEATQDFLTALWQSRRGTEYLAELGLDQPQRHDHWLTLSVLSGWQQQLVQFDQCGAVTFIQLQTQPNWQSTDLDLPTSMQWFRPLDDASDALGELRRQLSAWLLIALVVAFSMLLWQRNIWVAICSVAYLGFIFALSLYMSQLVSGELHVFHLVAVILVMSLALDYLVFFSSPLQASSMHVAVNLSAATSLFAFGLLSFSATPAIASFGTTILFGILAAALLAPLINRVKGNVET